MEDFRRPAVVPVQALKHLQRHSQGNEFPDSQARRGVARAYLRNPSYFRGHVLEVVSVLVQFDNLEVMGGQVRSIKIAAETSVEMVRRKMREAAERRGDDELASWPQQAREFLNRQNRVRQMFEDLNAHDGVKGLVRFRNRRNVTDDIQPALVPASGRQPATVASAVVLREILRHVLEVVAMLLELKLAGACIEDALARGNIAQRLRDPCGACWHVVRANRANPQQPAHHLFDAGKLHGVGT